MLQELFKRQKSAIDHFFSSLDLKHCENIFNVLLACEGVIFFTGIGKSGYIAQKIAATMMSTGTKSLFLSPINALHGDLGMVSSKDLLIIFSKSGETEELLQLLPSIRNKAAKIIAITSNPQSRLVKSSDFFLELPCSVELCPFDLAPTTSAEIQLLFGDVIAVALMQAKGFTLNAFAENHPAGRIGRRATIKVKDLMLDVQKTPLCFPKDYLKDVLLDFSNKRCGCLVVIDENKSLKGIFTDGDLRRALQEKGEDVLRQSLKDIMTPSPRFIEANALAWEAMKLMEADQNHPIMVLPVLNQEKKIVGLIKMHDIIQAGL
jgi:arabinose-5-phosphate isomerase